MELNNCWVNGDPASVQPFYYAESTDGRFPDIRYAADHQVMGAQYMTPSRILLVAHDPAIPRVGPGQRRAVQWVTREIKQHVRRLYGVALSNPTTPAALLTACMGILLSGGWFTEREDQERLYDVLRLTEERHGWPTSTIQEQLRQTWDWSSPPEG